MNGYMRRQILIVYDYTCQYCNQQYEDGFLEVDHIHPKSLGGEDKLANYTVACFHCNRKKKDSILPESLKLLLLTVAERKAVVVKKRLAEARQRRTRKSQEIVVAVCLPPSPPSTNQPVDFSDWIHSSPKLIVEVGGMIVSCPRPRSVLQPNIVSFLLKEYLRHRTVSAERLQISLEEMRHNSEFLSQLQGWEIQEAVDWSFYVSLRIRDDTYYGVFSHTYSRRYVNSEILGGIELSSLLDQTDSELANNALQTVCEETRLSCG